MDGTTRIAGATYPDDLSGLKLPPDRRYTLEEIYTYEARNILKATLKYLSAVPGHGTAPFNFEWMSTLHREMFGDVWDWAGQFRQIELSIGIQAYRVPTELKKLCDDLTFWREHQTFSPAETAARLHHRAVWIHPFLNGNGRWARMLANIYLRQEGLNPIRWSEGSLAKTHPLRDRYITALRAADRGEFNPLIELMKEGTTTKSGSDIVGK
jgi:Fic-DOC domain mobile mystery protein B